MRRQSTFLVLASALLCAAALEAQPVDSPHNERGFSANKVFEIGDIDHVSPFDGSLVITLPIGGEYPLRPGFTYGLTLTYNGKVWEKEFRPNPEIPNDYFVTYEPYEGFNGGVGWTLSLGRLLEPQADPLNQGNSLWVYVGGDGSRHDFFSELHPGAGTQAGASFTRDNSYLRMKSINSASRVVQFPDGSQRFFEPAGGGTGEWRLTRLEDAYGNWMNVTYPGTSWRLEDMHGRVHEVHFSGGQVSSVQVERFGTDAPATWAFDYTDISLSLRACGLTSDPLDKRTFNMKFLSSITRPDGSTFQMPNYAISSGASLCNPTTGRIRELVLPTLGKIEWVYGTYPMGRERCATAGCQTGPTFTPSEAVQGVVQRRLVRASGGVEGTWTYQPSIDTPIDASERTTLVIDPLGHQTKYYFSVHRHDTDFDGSSSNGWTRLEYGLPLTRNVPLTVNMPGGPRDLYLSQEIFEAGADPEVDEPIRSNYVRYERETPLSLELEHMQHANRRVAHQLTVYHDTHNDDGQFGFTETLWSDFDGLGNYRTVRQRGNQTNLATVEWKEAHTEFNLGVGTLETDPATGQASASSTFTMPGAGSPWVLTTSSFQEARQQNDAGRLRRVETTFRSDGFLLCERRLVGANGSTSRSSDDVMRVFTDADGDGNAESEMSYGGDAQSLSTGAGCSATGLPEYQTDFQYTSGALSRSVAVKRCPGGQCEALVLSDLDIDSHTGLARASRDAAGVPTAYTYDALARLTSIVPQVHPSHPGPGSVEARTDYAYVNAAANRAARVHVTRGSDLTASRMLFDDWGRLCREQSRLPEGWSSRQTTYTATGLLFEVTEVSAAALAETCGSVTTSRTTYSGYDPFGRPGRIEPADGANHEVTFIRRGVQREVQEVRKAIGAGGSEQPVAKDTFFDSFGRLRLVREFSDELPVSVGHIDTVYTYDPRDQLIEVDTNSPDSAENQMRFFAYDGRGVLSAESHPELSSPQNPALGTISYRYDSRGNVVERSDSRASLVTSYDAAGRPVTVHENLGSGLRKTKEFFYASSNRSGEWSAGQLAETRRHHYIDLSNALNRGTDFVLTVSERFRYGGRGGRVSSHLTSATTTIGTVYAFRSSYGYDSLGNVSTLTYPECLHASCPDPTGEIDSLSLAYSEGLLRSISGYVNQISYHRNGLVHQVNHTNGRVETTSIASNNLARPASISVSGAGGWSSGSYGYDGSGNIKAIGSDTFQYDEVDRLSRANLDGSIAAGHYRAFSWDIHGNRRSIDRNGISTTEPIRHGKNQLGNGIYDDSGNLVGFTNANLQFSWDGHNTMMAGVGPDFTKVYLYTASDERVASIDLTDQASGEIREVWTLRGLGQEVLRTYTTENGLWTWERDQIYRDGRMVAAETAEDGGAIHYHLDHLGSPRQITQADGSVKSNHVYYPFGEEWTAPGEERQKFTGHERDQNGTFFAAGDDLDYMHARYCSPAFGRFLSVDPADSAEASVPQSWNAYSYARANPLKFIDPDGEAIETPWDAANVALGAASLGANLASGNLGGAALDVAGLAFDVFATAVPALPAAGATTIRAARLAENAKIGRKFENAALTALGASRNRAKVTQVSTRVTTIPDVLGGAFGVLDVKNVTKLSLTKQLRSQQAAAASGGTAFNLIISPRTKTVSVPLQDAINRSGGRIFVFDAETGKFFDVAFKGNKVRVSSP